MPESPKHKHTNNDQLTFSCTVAWCDCCRSHFAQSIRAYVPSAHGKAYVSQQHLTLCTVHTNKFASIMKAFCCFFPGSDCCCHTRAFSPTPYWMYGVRIAIASDSFHNVTLASNQPQTLRLFEQQHHQQQQQARVLYKHKRKLFVLFLAPFFRPPTCSSNKIFHLFFRFESTGFFNRTSYTLATFPFIAAPLPKHGQNKATIRSLCAPLCAGRRN